VNRAVPRFNQRQGFLVSAIVHLSMLMILVSRVPKEVPKVAEAIAPKSERVFMPPPSVLRQLAPARPRTAPPLAPAIPQPPPVEKPPTETKKDRMSIGAPTTEVRKEPLILRRDQDLTNVAPKGRTEGVPAPPSPSMAPTPEPERAAASGGAREVPGSPGLLLPPGIGRDTGSGSEGSRARPGAEGPIASSARDLERRMAQAPLGIPSGTGNFRQMGPLAFDPQGADFTAWINHFKNEIYRNWIVPKPAEFGFRGHVDFEFTVERDGTITGLHVILPSGTTALDRAAQNALIGSRFLPLPSDFGPPRVTMRVSFFYNVEPGPQAS
jgi:TonB family protein